MTRRVGRDADVVVVGAGVIGLTTALVLAEAGLHVRCWAAERPEQTTSRAAGALWGPHLVEPVERVEIWARETLVELEELADQAGTGVRLVTGLDASRPGGEPPGWAAGLDDFRVADTDELPDGFASGVWYTAPLVDMPVYLSYLERRLAESGTNIETRRLASLGETIDVSPITVNCAGLGARELVPDRGVTPVRGQLVSVTNLGIDQFFTEDTGLSPHLLHIYPHTDSIILGGVAQADRWEREPDPATAESIIRRTAEVIPALATAETIDHRVGLRPTREQVRVEREPIGDTRTVIHNYGHGGAGVSLSWGCAMEVLRLIDPSIAPVRGR